MTDWLIDKSALARLGASPDATEWANRIERGLVRVTSVTLLEVGFSARSAGDLRHALGSAPLRSMAVEYFTPAIEDRAIEVQAILAERGQHRAPSIPDLLVAAAAETGAAHRAARGQGLRAHRRSHWTARRAAQPTLTHTRAFDGAPEDR